MTTERRQTARQRALLGAKASYNAHGATLDCVVRNISDGGALLIVSEAVALPHVFQLEIVQRRRAYSAHVRWRAGDRVGVSFAGDLPPLPAGTVDLDMAARLRMAERENARLKHRVVQLTEPG